MKESIGYTVSLNIMIVFITIIVAFLCAALIYFKSNKVSNVITSAIEKYEGYEDAQNEINMQLSSLGYGSHSIEAKCRRETEILDEGAASGKCNLLGDEFVNAQGQKGYCVYSCFEEDNFDADGKYQGEYYYYKIRTNMMVTVPILNDFLDIPIYSNTNRLYNFGKAGSLVEETLPEYICTRAASSRYGNVPQGNFVPGDEYNCNVNGTDIYPFYVIKNEGQNVLLLAAENIDNTGYENKHTIYENWNVVTRLPSMNDINYGPERYELGRHVRIITDSSPFTKNIGSCGGGGSAKNSPYWLVERSVYTTVNAVGDAWVVCMQDESRAALDGWTIQYRGTVNKAGVRPVIKVSEDDME